MLNPFAKREVQGSELIADALAQFDGIAVKLEAGAAQNQERVAGNKQVIASLEAENTVLDQIGNKGLSVAKKLRALTS
jgi:hypothetical protein